MQLVNPESEIPPLDTPNQNNSMEVGGDAKKDPDVTHMELLLTYEEYNAVDSIQGHEQDVHYAVMLANETGDDRWKIEGKADVFRKLHNTVAEDINAGIHDADDAQALESVYKKLRQQLKSEFTIV